MVKFRDANTGTYYYTNPYTNAIRSGDAFSQIEAESYYSQSGIQTETCNDTGGTSDVGWIENGDYTVYNNVNFGSGCSTVPGEGSQDTSGSNIEIRLDSLSGTPVGTLTSLKYRRLD